MDAEIETLRKVDALTRSSNKGEAAAARSRLTALLKKRGKAMADLPSILDAPKPVEPPPSPLGNMFAGFDDYMEKQEPGYSARKAKGKADYHAAVVAKYGSVEAAIASTPMERAVDAAMAPITRTIMFEFFDGTSPVDTLDGWTGYGEGGRGIVAPPDHVVALVRSALPLPTTIAAAKAEYDAWIERDRELFAARGGGDTCLSRGCSLRKDIVRDLLYTDLRACSFDDAIVRHKALIDRSTSPEKEEQAAVLADLEHLAALESAPPASPAATKPVKRPKRQPDKQQTDFGF